LGFFSWRSGFVYDGVIPLALVEGGSALVDFTLAIDDIHTTASTTILFFFFVFIYNYYPWPFTSLALLQSSRPCYLHFPCFMRRCLLWSTRPRSGHKFFDNFAPKSMILRFHSPAIIFFLFLLDFGDLRYVPPVGSHYYYYYYHHHYGTSFYVFYVCSIE
jgi:hypothetical protein